MRSSAGSRAAMAAGPCQRLKRLRMQRQPVIGLGAGRLGTRLDRIEARDEPCRARLARAARNARRWRICRGPGPSRSSSSDDDHLRLVQSGNARPSGAAEGERAPSRSCRIVERLVACQRAFGNWLQQIARSGAAESAT